MKPFYCCEICEKLYDSEAAAEVCEQKCAIEQKQKQNEYEYEEFIKDFDKLQELIDTMHVAADESNKAHERFRQAHNAAWEFNAEINKKYPNCKIEIDKTGQIFGTYMKKSDDSLQITFNKIEDIEDIEENTENIEERTDSLPKEATLSLKSPSYKDFYSAIRSLFEEGFFGK